MVGTTTNYLTLVKYCSKDKFYPQHLNKHVAGRIKEIYPTLDPEIHKALSKYLNHCFSHADTKSWRVRDIREPFRILLKSLYTYPTGKDTDTSMVCEGLIMSIIRKFMNDKYVMLTESLQSHNLKCFWNDGEKLLKHTNIRPLKKHKWGYLMPEIKGKTFTNNSSATLNMSTIKWRPLISTRKHIYKNIYNIATLVLNELLRIALGPRPTHNVQSLREVREYISATDKLNESNATVLSQSSYDIESFFDNVDVEVAINVITIARRRLHRFNYARLPKNPNITKEQKVNGNRTIQPIRNGVTLNGVGFTAAKPDPRFYYYLSLDQLIPIVRHACKYSYARALGQVWHRASGAPQGCSLSEPISEAYARYHEIAKGDNSTMRVRFRDDIKVFDSATHPDPIDQHYYGSECPIKKEECSANYLGTTSTINGGKIAITPNLPTKDIATAKSFTSRHRAIVTGEAHRINQYTNKLGRLQPRYKEVIKAYYNRLVNAGYRKNMVSNVFYDILNYRP